jgi:hypothetical protein
MYCSNPDLSALDRAPLFRSSESSRASTFSSSISTVSNPARFRCVMRSLGKRFRSLLRRLEMKRRKRDWR